MQLILITPDTTNGDETTVVNQLFGLGLQRLHLRKPGFSADDYRQYIGAIDTGYHGRVVLSGSFDLWSEFALGGIHLNSTMRTDAGVKDEIRNIPTSFISTSFHSWQEVLDNDFPYGYVFISPVFDSISKRGYAAGIDLAGAQTTKLKLRGSNRNVPDVIGLGGVDSAGLTTLARNGFDGGAVLGAVWTAADPVAKFIELQGVLTETGG